MVPMGTAGGQKGSRKFGTSYGDCRMILVWLARTLSTPLSTSSERPKTDRKRPHHR